MTILPAVPFPNALWLKYYQAAEEVTIDLGEHYLKQTWRNRFDLIGSHGPFACTARVVGQKGEKIPTGSIRLVNDDWRRTAIRGLTAGYARAPYFEDYITEVVELLEADQALLSEFSIRTLDFTLRSINWPVKHRISQEFVNTPLEDNDLRLSFKPSRAEFKQLPYPQVFEDRFGFVSGLSSLDLIFNTGPEAPMYLR